jgi:hypothetical protein
VPVVSLIKDETIISQKSAAYSGCRKNLPGESREITATYRPKLLGSARPVVTVKAWNTN